MCVRLIEFHSLFTFVFIWDRSTLCCASCLCYIKALLQKVLLCLLFSTTEIKNRNVHALWMYVPSRKCAVVGVCHWLRTITWASASQAAIGWHLWGLCEEKLFWQDPGAQRSRWKLGEGQCRWNQEWWAGSRDGITTTVSERLLGCDLPATAKGRIVARWSHGYRDRRGQWFTAMTLREHES